jgi:hypothetical protein
MERQLSIGRLPEGGYTADEARLDYQGLSVELTGFQFNGGYALCARCYELAGAPPTAGYLQKVYRADGLVRRRCALCTVPFPGMTGLEDWNRRCGNTPRNGSHPPSQ